MKKKIHTIIREDNFLSLAGNAFIALFGLAGFALLARSLDTTRFGQWVLFISAGSFVEMFRFGITNTAVVRYLSGADADMRLQITGANTVIGLTSTIIISAILFGCNLLFGNAAERAGYGLFFTWYPLLAFINLSWNNALVLLQAERRFGKMLLVKLVNSGSFFFVILWHFLVSPLSLTQLAIAMLAVNLLTSALTFFTGWDGSRHIMASTKSAISTLLHFGKYTTFTLIGTNLLRSADAIIISLSPMGVQAVGLYSIPMKLTELQQIPLRSFAATAFPKLSKASLQGNTTEVKSVFYSYTGAISYLFIAGSLFTFVFAEFFVWILSGNQYLQQAGAGDAVMIMRVFSLYGLLLPIDRMTGITLDSINKPQVNALKVLVMVIANIAGDLIAVFVFQSLVMVAIASVLFTLAGIWLGMYFLKKDLALEYRPILEHGNRFYITLYKKMMPASMAGMHK